MTWAFGKTRTFGNKKAFQNSSAFFENGPSCRPAIRTAISLPVILFAILLFPILSSCRSLGGVSDSHAAAPAGREHITMQIFIFPEVITPHEFRAREFPAGGGMVLRVADLKTVIVKRAGGRRYRLGRESNAGSAILDKNPKQAVFRRNLPPGTYTIVELIFDTDYDYVRGEMRFSFVITGGNAGNREGADNSSSSLETGITVGKYLSVGMNVANRPSFYLPVSGTTAYEKESEPIQFRYRIKTLQSTDDYENLAPGETDIDLLAVPPGMGASGPMQRITR